jgi:hypothetical protein
MILGTAGTQFLSTVSEPVVVFVRKRCQRLPKNWASWMIFGSLGPSFPHRFWASNSLRTLKISSSAVEQVFEDDFGNTRYSVFVDCF